MNDTRDNPSPQEIPTALESYARGWATLTRCPGALGRIAVAFFIGQLPTHLFSTFGDGPDASSGIGLVVYHLVILGPLGFGLAYALLVASRDYDPFVSDLLLPFLKRWGATLWANLLTIAAMVASSFPAIGALLLLTTQESPSAFLLAAALACAWLPILAAIRLGFAPYLLLEGGRDPATALAESWERTQPAQTRILGIQAIAFALNLPGMVLAFAVSPAAGGLAMLPGAILGGLAFASLYAACVPEENRPEAVKEDPNGASSEDHEEAPLPDRDDSRLGEADS